MASIATSSPSALNAPIPFAQGKYTGAVQCTIHQNDQAHLISVAGERLSLETFTSPYSQEFKNKFNTLTTNHPEIISRAEFSSLAKIFQNPENVKNYSNGQVNTDAQIIKRLDYDSLRPLKGDSFTGFGVVDKQSGEVIGRAAVGHGDKPGESQFGLILRSDYHAKKFGKETAILIAALALVYFESQLLVGDDEHKAPVISFTATALNNNLSTHLLKMGCTPIKTLPSGWFQRFAHFVYLDRLMECLGYPLAMRKLYEIKGEELRPALSKCMDLNRLKVTHIKV